MILKYTPISEILKFEKICILKSIRYSIYLNNKKWSKSYKAPSNNHNSPYSQFGIYSYLFGIWTALVGFSEKAVAPHSSTLAWKIPWAEEPGRL